ncbi:MAG: MEDS domain-containing protein [Pseudonocardia sp.]
MVITSGDHICCFYSGADERDRILRAYLRAGLRHGDKCICLIDSTEPHVVRRQVEDEGVAAASDQLVVEPAGPAYLRNGGRFSPDIMIEYLDETIGAALATDAFRFVRTVGEMSWVLREPPASEELFTYEAAINRFAPRYPQALLCMYDLRRFGGGMLVDAMTTHPKLLIGNLLVQNPWCMVA